MATTTRTHDAPAAMIDRVASLLDAFDGPRSLTLAEIAQRTGLPRSSTHRILRRLVELGWVEREGFEYGLGLRMFELGAQVAPQRRLRETAAPVLTALHLRTSLTAHLSILAGPDVLHLERLGPPPGPGAGWSVGARQAAALTAPGRALLAGLDPQRWPELSFQQAPTCYSVRSSRQLARELGTVHDRGGVAVDSQGCVLGVTVVAAAIGGLCESAPAAVSLSGSTRSVSIENATAAVRSAAVDIRRRLLGLRPNARTGTTSGAGVLNSWS
ncbi:IclR family transcriptional regulator [Nocardia sp. NPDC059228]|uniref:IclR family transcriptional regulator n=1 Tax=Nocardia sp. NPDC059228 TaxID=3346777 RepID=UPI0036CDD852